MTPSSTAPLAAGALVLSLLCPPASAGTQRLGVPLVQQQHSQWCWSADASALLAFRGMSYAQCRIANWVDSVDYACGPYPFYWNDAANEPNYLAGTTGISGILWSLGRRDSRYYSGPLSFAATRSAIAGLAPVVVLWSWRSGGGHFVVVDGYADDGSMLYFMNPWPGEGAGYGNYRWMRYGTGDMGTHVWSESLIVY